MKSKEILKWTRWFYRTLVVLIVTLISVGPWFYLDGYKPYGGMAEVIEYLVEYQSLYLLSYICFGVILIGLILIVLSFIKPKKFKFFTVILAVSILIMAALIGTAILIPITYKEEISNVWWMATASSVVLLFTTVIGAICEKNLNKQEDGEIKKTVAGYVAASIYGIATLALIIASVVVINDKGWHIEDDTLYLEREVGIYHSWDDETLWGDGDFERIKVENGVRKIHYTGLCNNDDFEEVDLPKSLRVIGEFTFSDCKNLYEIDIPDSVEVIEWCAFRGCENLVEIELSKDLEMIDGWVFNGCTGLSYINLPNGLEVIGEYAFCGCDKLRNITIPKSVERIGKSAFPEDTVLTVGFGSYAEQWAIENGYTYEIY